ncbi:hypothetical protein ACIQ8G_04175 [Streptomyces sp. NPDC094154]|uniref:hypothetical protein n=1 Tax=Streptomyces sp. NPDC094154 TaxID=3366059 RepID=UPI003806D4D8
MLAGCSERGDDWKEPKQGQALVLLNTDADAAYNGFGDIPVGLTIARDNQVYGMFVDLVTIRKGSKLKTLQRHTNGLHGLVALPDNSLATGSGRQIVKLSSSGQQTVVLAGAEGVGRKAGQPAPRSVQAKRYRFADKGPTPFAARADGAILITDDDVIWSLKGDTLTRLYQIPADAYQSGTRFLPGRVASGTKRVYLATQPTLGGIQALDPDGTAHSLSLPRSVAGVTGDTAGLPVAWMTGDGAEGIYVNTHDKTHSYVLHLTHGEAELIVKSAPRDTNTTSNSVCKPGHLVDATKLPCPVPFALAYSAFSGSLVMAGSSSYVLRIPTE